MNSNFLVQWFRISMDGRYKVALADLTHREGSYIQDIVVHASHSCQVKERDPSKILSLPIRSGCSVSHKEIWDPMSLVFKRGIFFFYIRAISISIHQWNHKLLLAQSTWEGGRNRGSPEPISHTSGWLLASSLMDTFWNGLKMHNQITSGEWRTHMSETQPVRLDWAKVSADEGMLRYVCPLIDGNSPTEQRLASTTHINKGL